MAARARTIFQVYLTVNKTTILFEAGTHGQFLLRILNLTEMSVQTHFDIPKQYINTTPKRADHHLIDEDRVDGHVTKITFTDADADLINRNKWTKLPKHLEEQADKTFYNNKNAKLFTIACNKINLLNPANIFKKIKNKETLEVNFTNFHTKPTEFTDFFSELFSKLKIKITKDYLEECKSIFDFSQTTIIEAHNKQNDLIHDGNKLGETYFKKFGNIIKTENFQTLIGGA